MNHTAGSVNGRRLETHLASMLGLLPVTGLLILVTRSTVTHNSLLLL